MAPNKASRKPVDAELEFDPEDEEYDESLEEALIDEDFEEDSEQDSDEDADEESDDYDEPAPAPAPEKRDYYLDVNLENNGDGSKKSPFNTPAAFKNIRLAPGSTLFVRSHTVVKHLELVGDGTLEEPITLAPYGHEIGRAHV